MRKGAVNRSPRQGPRVDPRREQRQGPLFTLAQAKGAVGAIVPSSGCFTRNRSHLPGCPTPWASPAFLRLGTKPPVSPGGLGVHPLALLGDGAIILLPAYFRRLPARPQSFPQIPSNPFSLECPIRGPQSSPAAGTVQIQPEGENRGKAPKRPQGDAQASLGAPPFLWSPSSACAGGSEAPGAGPHLEPRGRHRRAARGRPCGRGGAQAPARCALAPDRPRPRSAAEAQPRGFASRLPNGYELGLS